ncbi:hypothetical protein BH09BAC6_BH09BAC6_34300 [soil metagenome]
MPSQADLIGEHPLPPDIFDTYFSCTDYAVTATQCHRSLVEKPDLDGDELVDWLARKIIDHHYDPDKLERLKRAYERAGFPLYAAQHRQLPEADRTKKGNGTEVVLIEYIDSCQADRNLFKAYKFRYNPNVDQSMKGDDSLMIDVIKDERGNDDLRIFLGEAKFRGAPDRAVLTELSSSLGKDKLPISYSFLVDVLFKDPATEAVGRLLENFLIAEIKAKGNLRYAGLLLSNSRTPDFVAANFNCDNPALVFISAGIEAPADLINAAFQKAKDLLANPDEL